MTTNDPTPHPPGEPDETGQPFADDFDLIDAEVDAIDDAHVADRLQQVLRNTGYDPAAERFYISEIDVQLGRSTDVDLTELIKGVGMAREAEQATCALLAVQREAAQAEARVRAARQEADDLHAAAARAAQEADQARKHAADLRAGADVYVDTALDRAADILTDAQAQATQIIADAERQAEGRHSSRHEAWMVTAEATAARLPLLASPSGTGAPDRPGPSSPASADFETALVHTVERERRDETIAFLATGLGHDGGPAPSGGAGMGMATVVQKYGGSSVATAERIGMVADRIARTRATGRPVAVVVSATGDTTDELLRLAARVSDAPPARETDQLLATGECASAALLAMALRARGVPAVSLTGAQAGFQVTGPHGGGSVERVRTKRVRSLLDAGNVVVVAGFQGVNADGDVVTLGRGGSDTSAVALAAELGARTCQIYTDVAGVFTADPRAVPNARLLHLLPADVMAELAFAGARVLHARSVELAQMSDMDIDVRDSATDRPGTLVESKGGLESRSCVVAVAHDPDAVHLLVDPGAAPGDLLDLLADQAAPPDLFAYTTPGPAGPAVGFTLAANAAARVRGPLGRLLAEAGGEMLADTAAGKVSVVGTGLLSRPHLTARVLSSLTSAGIAPTWIGASQMRVSAVVPLTETVRAAAILHRAFGLDRASAPA